MTEEPSNKMEELNKILSESRDTLKEINDHKEAATKKFESIQRFCTECESLGLVLHKERASDFKKRAQKLQKEVNIWGVIKVLSLVFLATSAFFIFKIQSTIIGNLALVEWARTLFIAPIIYLAYIASQNYEKARGLLERYEYKTATLNALPTDIELLKKEFPDNQKRILDFALEKMNLIFKEPYSTKRTKRSFFFKIKNIFNSRIEEVESTPSAPHTDHSKSNGVKVSEVKVVEKKNKVLDEV